MRRGAIRERAQRRYGRAVARDLHEVRGHIGFHVEEAFLSDTVDLGQLGHGLPGNEVRQRHEPVLRAHLERVEGGEHAVVFGQAHADVDFLVRGIDAHRVQKKPAGDKLHHRAHGRHIRTVAAGLFHIDVDLPVDAGQRARILDQRQARRRLELRAGGRGGLQEIGPVVAADAQMHGLCRGRAHGEVHHLGLNAGDGSELLGQFRDDAVAVKLWVVLAVFPGDRLELDLTDRVLGGLGPARIAVEPAIARKGEGVAGAGMSDHDLLGAGHERVLFGKAQVAPGADIEKRLFGLAFDEEFDAVIVLAKVGKDRDHEEDHRRDRHERADGIADDGGDDPAEGRPAIACADALFLTSDRRRAHRNGCQDRENQEDRDAGYPAGPAFGHGREQVGGVQHHHGAHEKAQKRDRHQRCANDPRGRCAQAFGGMIERAREAARDAAHDGQVDERHDKRGGEHEDQRDRQHAHELARNAGPEEHRQEGAERRRGGRDDGPEHALGGLHIGLHGARAFRDALVGIFHDDDRPVDQHADGQDQAEHHDVRHRNAHQCEEGEAQKERCRDGEAHEESRPRAERREHHDHHQRDGGQDRSLELADHGCHLPRLIVRGAKRHHGAQFGRPGGLGGGNLVLHQRHGVDDVEALALDHLQGDRRLSVEARGRGAVLEGQVDRGQIAQCHHPVAIHLHGQVIDVARIVEGGRDLDGEGAGFGLDLARRDELVVVAHDIDQLARRDVVAFKPQGIDHHFQHLVAIAGNACLEDRVEPFEAVLQVLGDLHHRALGHGARHVDDDDRKLGEVDLVDRILLGAAGELRLRVRHRVAHIGHDLGLVPAELELQHHARIAFGGGRGHSVEPVQIDQLGLHRLDQQRLGILGRDAGEGDRDEEGGDLDVGLALLGKGDVAERADRERERDEGQDHAGAFGRPVDDAGH